MRKSKIARKVVVVLHCIWVDGTSFDWGPGEGSLIRFCKVPGSVCRTGDVPLGRCCGGLVQFGSWRLDCSPLQTSRRPIQTAP